MRRAARLARVAMLAVNLAAMLATILATPTAARAAEPDLAFGAFQRGYFITAFAEATKRVEANGDPKAMTLLAEIYAN
jgi:hypothetical protein